MLRSSLRFGLLAAALWLAGCGGSGTGELDPYPNRRARFPTAERTLGYVANRESDSVSVLDLDAFTELGQVPVGRDPVDIDGPRRVVIDADAQQLYLVLSYPDAAQSPHAAANGNGPRAGYVLAFALDDLRPLGELRVAASPDDVALSDDHDELAVAHYDTVLALKNTPDIEARRATLAFVRPASALANGSPELTSLVTCVAPATVVYGSDRTRAFVACTGDDSLVAVDTVQPGVLARVPAGNAVANKPYALTRNRAGTLLAVSNQVAQTVVVFEAADTPVERASVAVPGVPFFATFLDDERLLVPLQGPSGAALIDTTTSSVLASATYADADCNSPSDARVLRDGRLFLTCEGDHYRNGQVVRLDPTTLALEATVSVGIYPDRLAVLEP